jgi:NAD(P)-dependent dehydrogenase (short-subunit alcohol dehydrogenase family)
MGDVQPCSRSGLFFLDIKLGSRKYPKEGKSWIPSTWFSSQVPAPASADYSPKRWLARGHTVFVTMRDLGGCNAKNAKEIRTLAEKDSLPIYVLEMDVTDDAWVERAVDTAIGRTGRIDVAINNAGYAVSGLAEAVTIEQAQRLMATNFFGSVRVNRAVLPYMRRQRSGVLMHISSGAGRVIAPSMGFYCASKFALEALAESYSYELAAQGIESVIVQPGPYETPVVNRSQRYVLDSTRLPF